MGEGGRARELMHKEEEHVSLQIEDRIKSSTSAQQPDEVTNFGTSSFPTSINILPLSLDPIATECRICQEVEDPSQLEAPCDCSGTLKYAHRECVQRWCNEKGDTTCEICHQPYKQGYSVLHSRYQAGSVPLDLSDTWELELRDPRILALAAAQRRLLESDYEDYSANHSRSAACCRSVVLILMALLLLRHATAMAAATQDDDVLLIIMIFLLRIIGFLLPCYIMVRTMNLLQRGQPEQTTAAEVSVLLRGWHPRGIRVAVLPASDLS